MVILSLCLFLLRLWLVFLNGCLYGIFLILFLLVPSVSLIYMSVVILSIVSARLVFKPYILPLIPSAAIVMTLESYRPVLVPKYLCVPVLVAVVKRAGIELEYLRPVVAVLFVGQSISPQEVKQVKGLCLCGKRPPTIDGFGFVRKFVR